MSQYGFPDLESPVSGEELINTHLEPTFAALYSSHSGASRPSYAVAGTIWVDTTTTPWLLKMFNGTANDITLGNIDPAAFTFSPRGVTQWGGSAGGTANALTLTPTIPLTAYAAGVAYECLITATNTSETVTVNISGIGARTVKCSVGAGKVNPPIGVLQNGMIARFVDDGTNLILLNVRPYNKSADIATAGTVNLDNASGDYVTLTGTTTVTAITLAEGVEKTCKAAGAFILTHGASLIVPGAANITTAAGDVFKVRGEASGVVRVISYTYADGRGGGWTLGADIATTSGSNIDLSTAIPAGVNEIAGSFTGVSTTGTGMPQVVLGDSGGYETTGYAGSVTNQTASVLTDALSSGFNFNVSVAQTAAATYNGHFVLLRQAGNKWTMNMTLFRSDTTGSIICGGSKTLSATLDRIKITTPNAWDTGTASIKWRY